MHTCNQRRIGPLQSIKTGFIGKNTIAGSGTIIPDATWPETFRIRTGSGYITLNICPKMDILAIFWRTCNSTRIPNVHAPCKSDIMSCPSVEVQPYNLSFQLVAVIYHPEMKSILASVLSYCAPS
jgi:hypothetical protein